MKVKVTKEDVDKAADEWVAANAAAVADADAAEAAYDAADAAYDAADAAVEAAAADEAAAWDKYIKLKREYNNGN